jgi:hypothetical protein
MKSNATQDLRIDCLLPEEATGSKTQAQLGKDYGVNQNVLDLRKRRSSGRKTDDVCRLNEFESEDAPFKVLRAERDLK